MPQIKAEKDAANQSESNRISFSISEDKYDAIYELYLKPGYYRGWSDFCYSAFRHLMFKFCEEMTGMINDINGANVPDAFALDAFKQERDSFLDELGKSMAKDYDVAPTRQIQVTLWPEILETMKSVGSDPDDVQFLLKIAIQRYSIDMIPEVKKAVDFKEKYEDLKRKKSSGSGFSGREYASKWIKKQSSNED